MPTSFGIIDTIIILVWLHGAWDPEGGTPLDWGSDMQFTLLLGSVAYVTQSFEVFPIPKIYNSFSAFISIMRMTYSSVL